MAWSPEKNENGKLFIRTAPFAEKSCAGEKFYTRCHGVTVTLPATGNVNADFVVPYTKAKINGAEFLWLPEGVVADFFVLDDASGTYSGTGTPYYQLNQFGFNCGISKDGYFKTMNYDADLYVGMVVRATLKVLTTVVTKTICVNYMIHEVK